MDARTGRLRLRVMLPEKLSMLAANVDGLRGRLLAIDENGQRIFALTASGLTVVQLARVPLGLGTIMCRPPLREALVPKASHRVLPVGPPSSTAPAPAVGRRLVVGCAP